MKIPVKIVVTGFSAFHGVEHNPTQTLIERVSKALKDGGLTLPDNCEVVVLDVLRVAASTVRAWLHQQYERCREEYSDCRVLFLHLGVDCTRAWFSLEACAVNEATFTCPDADGFVPREEPIDASEPVTAVLDTDLDLAALCAALTPLVPTAVKLSESAGRFVCNYTYFCSLQQAAAACQLLGSRRWHALFVHVPPFEVAGFDEQFLLVQQLLKRLCDMLSG